MIVHAENCNMEGDVLVPQMDAARSIESIAVLRTERPMTHHPPDEAARPGVDPVDWADVQASTQGDGQAFARLVGRHQQAVAGFLWRFTRDRRQWEELVQDAFVEAYFSLRTFRGQAPLVHWLRRIATRVGYRYWTQQGRARAEAAALAAMPPRVEEPVDSDAAEAGTLVHSLLAEMAPRDRLALTLHYLEACPVAEIARLTGWSQALVKVQLHRARKRLKKRLEERERKSCSH